MAAIDPAATRPVSAASVVGELRVAPPPRALWSLGEGLTRVVRPSIRIGGRTWPAYGFFVASGVVLGSGWAVTLAALRDAHPLFGLGLAVAGLAAALALALVTKAATGVERFTFYHYQLVVLAAVGALLRSCNQPVLAGLDLLAVALAVTDAVGRLGCLAAGCCHGRAAPWGVRYGAAHARAGFPADLVGVALLPLPLVESLGVALLAGWTSVLVVSTRQPGGAPPGTALALYVAGYALLRFFLERLRGDSRPHLLGLSEAQWTALGALAAVSGLGSAGRLPLGDVGVVAGPCALVLLAAIAVVDGRPEGRGLLSSPHATEIAGHLMRLAHEAPPPAAAFAKRPIGLRTTSQRLRLSTGLVGAPDARRVVSFSAEEATIPAPLASALARRLLGSSGLGPAGQLVRGNAGVWHLLVAEPSPTEEA
jgi:phosphatidylglycerol:prolipoprotein diacylglycerol transferase